MLTASRQRRDGKPANLSHRIWTTYKNWTTQISLVILGAQLAAMTLRCLT